MAEAPERGEVYWYEFESPDKRRPVVVVSRNRANAVLRHVHVVPVTTADRRYVPTAVELDAGEPVAGFVMADGLQLISKASLHEPGGRLSAEAMRQIGRALLITLDIEV